MTKLANTTAFDDSAQGKSPAAQAEPSLYDQGRPAFRFGLRHLFWFVTGVSVLLAATASFPEGSYGSLALLLAIAVVALHLMSTAVGSHLRAEADKHTAVFLPTDVSAALASKAAEASHSPLRTHGLAVRWLPLLVAAGAVVGGCIGAVLLELTIGSRTTSLGVAVGALSTAVLGAWCAFIGSNFSAILRRGWRDAVADPKTN
jgi:hypothetical protein